MPISNIHKLCFVHIPKTAGSSIETTLDMKHAECLYTHYKYKLYSVTAQHLDLDSICREIPETQNYDIFTVVRNPFDRLVSEYKHYHKNWWAREFFKIDNFEKFVDTALSLSKEERIFKFDNHLEPQINFLNRDDLKVNIFKFEDLYKLEEWLTEKIKQPIKLPHERKTEKTDYREFYKSESIYEKVKKFYEEDMKRFSYS
jgi:hypothetical protein